MIKVLYIEDDFEDALIVSRYLTQSRDAIDLHVASTGAEARDKLQHNSFDCVLLDQNLPDTNGLALLQDIKSKWPKMPVLMLTGQKDDRLTVGSSILGADDFIVKDEISTAVLTETIFSVVHLGENIEEDSDLRAGAVPLGETESTAFKHGAYGIYETLINTMTEGLISLDLNGTILFANQQAGDLLKRPVNSLFGERASVLFDASDFRLFEEKFTENKKGLTLKYEAQFTCLDGTRIPAIISQSPYYDRWHHLAGCLMVVTDISDRKQAENMLRASEKRFRDIAENTTDLIWEMNPFRCFTYVNPLVRNILGFSPEEILGRCIDEIMLASSQDRTGNGNGADSDNRLSVKVVEGIWRHKNGSEIILEMSSIPIYDAVGKLLGYRGISRDITDRKQMEEARLREREMDLNLERCISQVSRHLIESENVDEAIRHNLELIGKTFNADHCFVYTRGDVDNPDHFFKKYFWNARSGADWFADQTHMVLDANSSWAKLLSSNQVVILPDAAHAGDDSVSEADYLRDLRISAILLVPLFLQDAFYGYVGIDYIAKAHNWRMTEIAAVRTMIENISKVFERKHARAALSQQKAKYETVIKSTSDGIILLDNNLKITLINPAALKILHCFYRDTKAKSILKDLGDISVGDILTTIKQNNLSSISREIKISNGIMRFFNVVFSSVKNIKAEVIGLVVNIHEISEIRNAQEQLIHSSKLASLGQLAAGVAHELNNPLTYMLGYAELLHSNQEDPEVKLKLSKILDGGRRVKGIIEDMLEFSHNQTQNQELSDINKTIEKTLTLMGRRLSNHNIHLIKSFDKRLSLVYCNKGELQQVFLNLIQNAFDELVRSKVGDKIEIVTEQISRQNIRLKFIDNGPGMSEEIQQRIFEPFFTTKAPGEGTGLGLSISYKIIKKHDGAITVKSSVGKGTTFIIELPTRVDQVSKNSDITDLDLEFKGEGKSIETAKVVIVEDEEKSDSLVKILFRTEHQLVTISQISQALDMLRTDDLDVLLVDIKSLRHIKQYIQNGFIPQWKSRIIFLFDYPLNERVKASLWGKGIGCLALPFKIDEVIQLVNAVLERSKKAGR
ncbi:MAG: PAS domain S-box protein [Candidatus Zhuqueibacterota bacterium]